MLQLVQPLYEYVTWNEEGNHLKRLVELNAIHYFTAILALLSHNDCSSSFLKRKPDVK